MIQCVAGMLFHYSTLGIKRKDLEGVSSWGSSAAMVTYFKRAASSVDQNRKKD